MNDEYFVRDVMTAPVTSVPKDARLIDAALTLRTTGYRHLPIVDGERLVGLLSDRDLQRLTPSLLGKITQEEYNAIFEETQLERVMTRNPITTAPDVPLREVAAILQEKKLGCLPVVEADRLIGIVTKGDMLRVLLRLLEPTPVKRD